MKRILDSMPRKNGYNSSQVHGTLIGCHRRPQWCSHLHVKDHGGSGAAYRADKSNVDKRFSMKIGPWMLNINTQENHE